MHALRAPVVFDGTRFLPGGATVLVDGPTILGVEPVGFDVPADCPVTAYDGTLMPGLFDAHVHLVSDAGMGSLERAGTLAEDELDAVIVQSLRQQVAAGVTTVRDLGDVGFRTLVHRDRAAPGLPRIVASGPPLTVADGHCHYLGGVVGTEQVRSAVRAHHDRGVDVVKVMATGGMITLGSDVFGVQFSSDDLRLFVETAHEHDLQVLAHAHSLAGIEQGLDAGVDGFEHFTGLTPAGIGMPDTVLERTARQGVAVDMTFGLDQAVMDALPAPPAGALEIMRRTGLDLETATAARRAVAGRVREHGITMVAGVDSGASPPKRHGAIGLALADLVTAGYPIHEALTTATSVAAAACGLDGVTGSLSPSLAADLLVVDGDPRSDLDALTRPVRVLVRGVDALE